MMKRNLLIMACALLSTIAFGQVGILTSKPNLKAGLHIAERNDPTSNSAPDRYNGLLIQRYTTEERANIDPGATENGLSIYNITTNCFNVWNWDTETSQGVWAEMCGEKPAKIDFTNCSSIKVEGVYNSDLPVEGNQTVRIVVAINVTALGSYNYSGVINGITFSAEGSFVSFGAQNVYMYPISGTPTVASTTATGSVTITPTNSSVASVASCSDVKLKFINRSSSTMIVLNLAGDQNLSNLIGPSTSGGAYSEVGSWLNGGFYLGALPAKTYAGTSNVQVVDVPTGASGSINRFHNLLKIASIVWVSAKEWSPGTASAYGSLLRDWVAAKQGIVMITCDKEQEAGIAAELNYYVEDGDTQMSRATGQNTLPEVFTSTSIPTPFAFTTDQTFGNSGASTGFITSNSGVEIGEIAAGNDAGATSMFGDTTRGVFIFGDKFGDTIGAHKTNFEQYLIDIFAWSLKNAPVK
ncbi:hypothetical protein J3D55_004056 [Chryseobacterium ginsenosidimutans]|nr:hypothetical protein [Chryseobacterium ginsenosidimutans]